MLSWQERFLQPEEEDEVGSEIYYFVDRDGNIHSREFLSEDRSLCRIDPSKCSVLIGRSQAQQEDYNLIEAYSRKNEERLPFQYTFIQVHSWPFSHLCFPSCFASSCEQTISPPHSGHVTVHLMISFCSSSSAIVPPLGLLIKA